MIGQNKMTQTKGELHALHTFRGFTGCTVGVSAQRSTSKQCFIQAVGTVFDQYLSDQVRFIFSDSPMRIINAARCSFRNLLAVGEDGIHLPIRLEYCWGEATTKASARVRQLHNKFNVSTPTIESFWQPEDHLETSTMWPDHAILDTRTPAEWKLFCRTPFDSLSGHSTYVSELAKIGYAHKQLMARSNRKGVTALDILMNGASRQHFEGLQNSSRLLARLGSFGTRLATGTTRNEQLHRELKSWSRNFYQTHKDRLLNGFRIFELAKLLTHASAAYSPTLTQFRQRKLLVLIAGRLRQDGFFREVLPTVGKTFISSALEKDSLQSACVQTNKSSTLARKKKRRIDKQKWDYCEKKPSCRKTSNTDIFRRARKKKSTR